MEHLTTVEPQILRELRQAEWLFCFLDFDGTLAPLAAAPDQVRPVAGTAELLNNLAALPGIRVAVVSGRSVADLQRFLDVPEVYFVGLHGLEIRTPGGTIELSIDVNELQRVLPEIKRTIEQTLAGRSGVLIEDKGLAIACHYRLAGQVDAQAVRVTVAAIVDEYQREGVPITLLSGHKVVEIRPAGIDKGRTVCRLLETYHPSAMALYIGDDQTDEDAFHQLPADAITIRVAPPTTRTAARFRLGDPHEVQRFLLALIEQRRPGENPTRVQES